MATKNKPFRPLLVYYNKEEHNRVEKLIEEKLMLLDEASVWINNVFDRDGEKVNMKKTYYYILSRYFFILNCLTTNTMKKLLLVLMFVPLVSFGQNEIDYDILYPDRSILIKFHNDFTKNHYPNRIAEFKKNPLSSMGIVFLGNSITEEGGDWGKKINMDGVSNRGISGDTTDGILERLNEVFFFKPKAIFILIGINDLWSFHNDLGVPSINYIENNIIKIVKAINNGSPETMVFVQSILPTKNAFFVSHINKINNFLKQNKNKYDFEFIDLYSSFVDSKGLIKFDLTYDDAHLNEKGYAVWVENLRDIISLLN